MKNLQWKRNSSIILMDAFWVVSLFSIWKKKREKNAFFSIIKLFAFRWWENSINKKTTATENSWNGKKVVISNKFCVILMEYCKSKGWERASYRHIHFFFVRVFLLLWLRAIFIAPLNYFFFFFCSLSNVPLFHIFLRRSHKFLLVYLKFQYCCCCCWRGCFCYYMI